MSSNLLRRVRGEWSPLGRLSRAGLQLRTPLRDADSDDEEVEADFNRIQELLRQRLESLQLTVETDKNNEKTKESNNNKNDRKQHDMEKLNKQRIKSEATTPNEIILSLGQSRTEVLTVLREILLAHFYQMVVQKLIIVWNDEHIDTKEYVGEVQVEQFIKVFTDGDYRTDVEFYYLVRSLVALLVSDIDEFGMFITPGLLGTFQHLVQEGSSLVVTLANKATLINGLSIMTLALHHGLSNFGVDVCAKWLMDSAEGFATSAFNMSQELALGDREYLTIITDKDSDKKLVLEAVLKVQEEASVAVAALQGLATMLTLLTPGEYLNELVEELMFKLVPLVDNESDMEISKAAARVMAVIYEVYLYEDDNEDDDDEEFNANSPYYEQEQLFSILDRLASILTKKISKKDKKEGRLVFRNVVNSMRALVDTEKRKAVYSHLEEGAEITANCFPNITLRLSKYRQWPIDTWGLYLRLRQLRWCFSFGLHNQLVALELLRDLLKQDTDRRSQLDIDHLRLDEAGYTDLVDDAMDKVNTLNDKKRTAKRKKDREEKFHEKMGDHNN